MYTFRETTVTIILLPSDKGSNRKALSSLGSKFFPYREDPFFRSGWQAHQEVSKVAFPVKRSENLAGIFCFATLLRIHMRSCYILITSKMSLCMTKPTKWHVRPALTEISLGIRPVWSESSLSASRKLWSLATQWAQSEDSDQTGRMPRLIWVFAGRTCHFIGFYHALTQI